MKGHIEAWREVVLGYQNLLLAMRPIFPYLWVMKTTVELPDELFQRAKVMSAERGTTLKDIMVQALQLWFRTPEKDEEKERQATVKRLLKAMRASNSEPMRPLKREEIYER